MRIQTIIKACFLGAFAVTVFVSTVHANCKGADLREAFSEQESQELAATLSATPYAVGNHWRATRGVKTVHLIGTIHLDDQRLGSIAERLDGVIRTSELLLLEISPDGEEALKKDMLTRPELIFLQNATLPEFMKEDDWQNLSVEMNARNIPPIMASRFQPWYLSVLLGMPPCIAQQLAAGGQMGLDNRLRDIAIAADVPISSLEPHDTLFYLFNDAPIEEQIEVMLLGLETQGQSLDMIETVVSAYFEENHAEAWEISRKLVMDIEDQSKERLAYLFDEMENDLLLARNKAWIPVILKALDDNDNISVAAGAGHFSGEMGVLALLEKEGFKLERLPF